MFAGMKIRTSVSLSDDLLVMADEYGRVAGLSRSELVERALRDYLTRAREAGPDRQDVELLDAHTEHFRRVMKDVLDYQAGGP